MSTKAMILAAGLGTRLRPVTDRIPKALVEIGGRTLLETAVLHLAEHGIKEIIVNVHHFAGQVIEYLEQKKNFGLDISISDESDQLFDTGGGLKKAAWFFGDGEPFIVRNVDVISDLDLSAMMDFHKQSHTLVTVAVRKRETSRYFLFDHDGRLCGWVNVKTGEKIICYEPAGETEMLAFSGIQEVDPAIFQLIKEEGKFSLTTLFLRLAKDHLIKGYMDESNVWKDVGKSPADLLT
ncbi:MAG: nucleotidyltransferase family protein [Bacteroidetes bacterium]|nr:nucleotidyltransferase family protein [Bacteroidota bacterium]